MRNKECVAMLLAGGQGSRLGTLTRKVAKPAVAFGGKYRIIDFSLSNCVNSNIDTIGVLTQYKPQLLNSYLGNGSSWDLDIPDGGLHILQPYATESGGRWYSGTADAIYNNMDFIEGFSPDYVLILSGDHLYKMDYTEMLQFHKLRDAALTVSVIEVPKKEASRFGIMTVSNDLQITRFSEKPKNPESTLASMGIYIFNWPVLRSALIEDHNDLSSSNDFGKDVIPRLLSQGKRLYAYPFCGYWQDIGTIESYYNAQMALLEDVPAFPIFEQKLRIYSNETTLPPHFVGPQGTISRSLVSNGCRILGTVRNCVLSPGVLVETGAIVENSVLLPGACVRRGARVFRAIIGENACVEKDACFCGGSERQAVAVLGDGVRYRAQQGERG